MGNMICTCNAAGRLQAELDRLDVCERLGVKPSDLCLAVCDSIRRDFGAETEAYADQWFGVYYRLCEESGGIECDHPLDGYVWTWKMLASRYPDKVRPAGSVVTGELRTECEAQVSSFATVMEELEAHRGSCAMCKDPNRSPFACAAANDLYNRRSDIVEQIDSKWGPPSLEERREWWGVEADED